MLSTTPRSLSHSLSSHSILLVEDDACLRETMQAILELDGYHVLSAANGREALHIYTAQPAQIGLVITDLEMPQLDGLGLMAALRGYDPYLSIIVMTGNSQAIDSPTHPVHQANRVLAKPCDCLRIIELLKTL